VREQRAALPTSVHEAHVGLAANTDWPFVRSAFTVMHVVSGVVVLTLTEVVVVVPPAGTPPTKAYSYEPDAVLPAAGVHEKVALPVDGS
jgi:hypothetical protein